MKAILLNEMQRQRIVQMVKPKKIDTMSYMNLDLVTAVCDEESGNILTLIYCLSESIRRSDDPFDEYKFVLLTENDSFSIYCKQYFYRVYAAGKAKEWYIENPCPLIVSDQKLLEMIKYYESSFFERREMAKKLLGAYYDKQFIEQYLTENYFETL